MILNEDKSPGRDVHQLDNRGSHFYLALYWAQALAAQSKSPVLQQRFADLASQLADQEAKILDELNCGSRIAPLISAGTTNPIPNKVADAMRPSETFNAAIESIA